MINSPVINMYYHDYFNKCHYCLVRIANRLVLHFTRLYGRKRSNNFFRFASKMDLKLIPLQGLLLTSIGKICASLEFVR